MSRFIILRSYQFLNDIFELALAIDVCSMAASAVTEDKADDVNEHR